MAENFESTIIPVQSRDQIPIPPDPIKLDNPTLNKWFQDFNNWARRLGVLTQIGSGAPDGEDPPLIIGDLLGGGTIHGHEFPDLPTENGVYWLKLTITGPDDGDVALEWGETVEGCSDCGS